LAIILQRQRALACTGEIRIGEKRRSARNTEYPAARDGYRFTSPNKAALDKLKEALGGELRPWADSDHKGQFELLTDKNQISVIVDTTFSLDENYELYDGKTRSRFCDGVTCLYREIVREGKEIKSCIDHGSVPCVCDPGEFAEELDDEDRDCDLVTTLKVMIPATADIVRWEFTSKGKIFNKEVFGMIETLRQMGYKQAFCLMTLEKLKKVRGNEVSVFPVVRLSIDPNPPNFVQALLANTPEAQARAVLEASRLQAPALEAGQSGAAALPQRTDAPSPMVGPTDPQRRDELQHVAMQWLKDQKWTAVSHQGNMTAFKNACVRGHLWWPEVFCMAIDARKTEWAEFIAFANEKSDAASDARLAAEREVAASTPSPFDNIEKPQSELIPEGEFTEVQ
jgi:hypothetical protein